MRAENNPRKISDEQMIKLTKSLQKFGLVDIPVVNQDMTIISGNQRVRALVAMGRDEPIDVRVAVKPLSEHDLKTYMLTANTHAGEWDFDLLLEEFSDLNLDDFGIDMPSFDEEKESKEHAVEDFRWFVNVEVDDERTARLLFDELTEKGYTPKVLN